MVTMISRCTSKINIRKFEEKVYYGQVKKGWDTPGATQQGPSRQRKENMEHGINRSSAFIGIDGGEAEGFEGLLCW